MLSNTGLGILGTVTDLGDGNYEATITAPSTPGIDSISIVVINNSDTVSLATIPLITYLNATSVGENGFKIPRAIYSVSKFSKSRLIQPPILHLKLRNPGL